MKSLNFRSRRITIALPLVASLVLSCRGAISPGAGATPDAGSSNGTGSGGASTSGTGSNSGTGNAPGASGGSGSTTGTGGGNAPGTGGASVPPPVGQVTPESSGPLALRRLTNREYSHMVADLLGDTTDPGSTFPLDGPTATGFEAPNGVADLNVQYYFQSADKLADTALAAGKIPLPTGCTAPAASGEATCVSNFITTFGRRVYRRPVAANEKTDLTTVFTKARSLGFAFSAAVAQVVKVMLQSPNFLYHWEIGPTTPVADAAGLIPLSSYQIAARLASTLWESIPDDTLSTAADMGQLANAAQVKTQAQRMLNDARAANALFNFHAQWLLQVNGHVTELNEVTKTSTLFTAAAKQSLEPEFTQFLTSVYATGDGTLNTLFTAPYTFVNAALAPIYGVTAPASGFAKVNLDATKRAGILTQTAFLAANADPSADNPVRRGLAIYLNVLCGHVNPPPAVVPDVSPASAGTTTRQRFAAHSQLACAQGCHTAFDPPGFAFENYDAIGGYRTTEAGQNVDATGSFVTPAGKTLTFKNAVDLAGQLAQSDEARWCIDRQWFRYMLGRAETPAEQGSLELAYNTAGMTTGYSVRDMLVTMASSKSFMYRK